MIQLLNIKKSYGSAAVLDIPALNLDHSIYWLKGMNGSGKTTLIETNCRSAAVQRRCSD